MKQNINKLQALVAHFVFNKGEIDKYKPYLMNEAYGKYAELIKFIKDGGNPISTNLYDIIGKDEVYTLTQASQNFLSDKDVKEYIKEITKYYLLGRTMEHYEEIDKDKVKKLYEFMNKIDRVSITTSDKFDKFLQFKKKIKENGKLGYPSGLATDKYTQGLIPGKVYTIGAFSNVGKSKLAYFIAQEQIKAGKKVIIFSLEVDVAMVMTNIISSYEFQSFEDVLFGDGVYDESKYENLTVYDDVYELDEIINIIEQEKPDVCFIDFVQNIRTQGASEYEKMTNIAIKLQGTAILSGTTIINLSQVNNDSRYNGGDKITLKGSGALFASSDVIFTMSRSDKGLKLTIAKNKYGKANIEYDVKANFEKGRFHLTEVPGLSF